MTLMREEASSSWQKIQQQNQSNKALYQQLAEKIRDFDPAFVYMVGRGTSDHAGVFARYLIEVELGVVVAAAAPSVASLFSRQLKLNKALVLLISQSGRSEDLLAQGRAAKQSGALVVALVNDISSPLAALADYAIPLLAGPEKAVAATKSYLCTLSALLQLVAHWEARPGFAGCIRYIACGLATSGRAASPAACRSDQNAASLCGVRAGFWLRHIQGNCAQN